MIGSPLKARGLNISIINSTSHKQGLSSLRHEQNCRMLVFSVTSLSFFENIWTSTNLGPYVVLGGKSSPAKVGNMHQILSSY